MLSKKLEETIQILDKRKSEIKNNIDNNEINKVAEIVVNTLSTLGLDSQRMKFIDNKLYVELRGYYDFFQILTNRYISNKLNEEQSNIVFSPYFQRNSASTIYINNKEIDVEDIYVYIQQGETLDHRIYIYINHELTENEKEMVKYEVCNMIFNEVEEAKYVVERLVVDIKMETMICLGQVNIQKEETIEDILNKWILIKGKLNDHEFKKGVYQIATHHRDLILENNDIKKIKENIPYIDFITIECDIEKREEIEDIISKSFGSELVLLTASSGEKYYLDYIIFDEKVKEEIKGLENIKMYEIK